MTTTQAPEAGLAERAVELLAGLDRADVGEPRVLAEALTMLVATRFKEQPVRMVARDAGGVRVETVQAVLAKHSAGPSNERVGA